MNFGLTDNAIDSIRQVFATNHKVEKVIIYGSRAKGNFHQGSDIDLTILGKEISLNDLNSLSIKLDNLLLPYTFDLSVFEMISNSNLKDHIQRVGKDFYVKPL